MEITYDNKARALYIPLPHELGDESEKQVKVHGGYEAIYLDYNKAHELIGIEILNVDEMPAIKDITYKPRARP